MTKRTSINFALFFSILFAALFFQAGAAEAASLHLSPSTGVYSAGVPFTARVTINTDGQTVNAAEGQLSFNPRELAVVSVTRNGSIFNLWTAEPSFSNSAGTITFGGGSPSGYRGSNGNVISVTFRPLAAGTPKVTFTSGSVLAADGLGTNVLTSMTGGNYTVNAQTENPEPEYIAPANTPGAPVITSTTHPDPAKWYQQTTAELSWTLPGDITGVRTLLDENAGTIPTIVYDTPITSRTLEDLSQGVSYFHIQFRNGEGWGRVTHYRLAIDTDPPSSFTISEPEEQDPSNPNKELVFEVEDISPVTRYLIQIDGGEASEYLDENETGRYTLPALDPGRHSLIVEAFDSAGNSLIATYAFDVASFDRPVFTDYPSSLNTEVIPVIKGSTRPRADVVITMTNQRGEEQQFEMKSDENGVFTFIPNSPFIRGVYELVAVATDEFGAKSEPSDPIRIAVDEPGYVKIGSLVVSVLSLLIPSLALVLLLIFGIWFLWHRLSRWRKRIIKETKEAEQQLAAEFATITKHLADQVSLLRESRKGKLTKAETALIDEIRRDIDAARKRIHKEISDIDDVVQ